jgi:hypothetical protein
MSLLCALMTSEVCITSKPRLKESYKLSVSDINVTEFIIEKKNVAMTIVKVCVLGPIFFGDSKIFSEQDKHLKNVKATTDFGEAQILAEILAVADENTRENVTDQNLFAVRVISTYVTFYKAEIPKAYLQELGRGLPKTQVVVIRRWPGQNGLRSGFDLAQPDGRQAVLTALAKIHRFLLQ